MLWDKMIKKAKEKGVLTIKEVEYDSFRYIIEDLDGYYWTCDMLELVERKNEKEPNVYLVKKDDKEKYIIANSESEALEKYGIKITLIK